MPQREYLQYNEVFRVVKDDLYNAQAKYLQEYLRENFANYDELPDNIKSCELGYYDSQNGQNEYNEAFEGTLEDIIAFVPKMNQYHNNDYAEWFCLKVEISDSGDIADYACLEISYDGYTFTWWETM